MLSGATAVLAQEGGGGSGSGMNGNVCSNKVSTLSAELTSDSCLSFERGQTYAYPADFAIKNKMAQYDCPTSNKRFIVSNGIPNHEVTQANPASPCEIPWHLEMPLNPTKTDTATEPLALGIVAMAVNGVPMYGAQEGGGTNAVEPAPDATITDALHWYGHAAPDGDWHYHSPQAGQKTMPAATDQVGYAMDGFKIFGPVDDASTLDQCNGIATNVSGVEGYQYHVRKLDQVDGTAEYCDGTSPAIVWKYSLGCYFGSLEHSKVGSCDEAAAMPDDCKLVAGDDDFITSGKCNIKNTAGATTTPVLMIAIIVLAIIIVIGCVVCYRRRANAEKKMESQSPI